MVKKLLLNIFLIAFCFSPEVTLPLFGRYLETTVKAQVKMMPKGLALFIDGRQTPIILFQKTKLSLMASCCVDCPTGKLFPGFVIHGTRYYIVRNNDEYCIAQDIVTLTGIFAEPATCPAMMYFNDYDPIEKSIPDADKGGIQLPASRIRIQERQRSFLYTVFVAPISQFIGYLFGSPL
jgi:hypothetical protein